MPAQSPPEAAGSSPGGEAVQAPDGLDLDAIVRLKGIRPPADYLDADTWQEVARLNAAAVLGLTEERNTIR